MLKKSFTKTIVVSVVALSAVVFSLGCDFNLVSYASRNACDILNCDVLFFIEDVLPLSARPESGAMAPTADADEGGGH